MIGRVGLDSLERSIYGSGYDGSFKDDFLITSVLKSVNTTVNNLYL